MFGVRSYSGVSWSKVAKGVMNGTGIKTSTQLWG